MSCILNKAQIVRVFVIEYVEAGEIKLWKHSLPPTFAMELGRELAKRGCRPVLRKLTITRAEVVARASSSRRPMAL